MHQRVRANVRQILGPKASDADVERLARSQWRNYMRYLRDFAALPRIARSETERIFERAEGWEHIDRAMSQGRGLVLASVHFGNWDLAAGTMARRHPVNVIADTFSSRLLDGFVNRRRKALGVQVIPVEKALKRTVSALRRNESVAFLVDKPLAGDAGVDVEFFGRRTRIPAGAAYFASRTGAPLIAAFVWRNEHGDFRVQVFPPIQVDPDLKTTMQQVIRVAEQVIRAHPEQWYMFRSMWSTSQEVGGTVDVDLTEEAVA